ncbi:MAG: sensor histidine kinase [Candidatus Dormibacter sp.]|uniref:sensor histidine kinase n=1 Tax=Candidatus Dormibacter sp. TaxID=2973982 RepID=UPI000DB56BF9|nr:MAG: hypothetical protein DLM66_05735 [Candidatus Dormibacteraeota bacterium]
MIWARWRREANSTEEGGLDPFADLLEEAPVMALLLDRNNRLLAANQAARGFFQIDVGRLPQGLLQATRESRLAEVLRAGRPDGEVRLTHHRRTVATRLVPGPRPGDTLLFASDVTELRRLERVRQEFVANLSHELKTPLTSLRLAAESLVADPPEGARRRFAERVVQDADHLTALVNNLRQLAEIEAEGGNLAVSRFGLAELLQEVVQRSAPEQLINLRIPSSLQVEADRSKLAQALANLLDNAAKFSPAGTGIDIRARAVEGEVHITVRDHGPGISPEHWERVFERFYKVDQARSRASGGSGLGLAIAKHLLLAQGGRIWTEAEPDGGQRFTIALPERRADTVPQAS